MEFVSSTGSTDLAAVRHGCLLTCISTRLCTAKIAYMLFPFMFAKGISRWYQPFLHLLRRLSGNVLGGERPGVERPQGCMRDRPITVGELIRR